MRDVDASAGAAPERSLDQRMAALANANRIRVRRAQMKRDLKARRASVVDVLLEPPVYAETMKVFDLLLAVPKYGRVKVNKTLVQTRISPSKTLGGLSLRQRAELVGMLSRSQEDYERGVALRVREREQRTHREAVEGERRQHAAAAQEAIAERRPPARVLDAFGHLRAGLEDVERDVDSRRYRVAR